MSLQFQQHRIAAHQHMCDSLVQMDEGVLIGFLGNLLLYESEELRRLWMNLHLAP